MLTVRGTVTEEGGWWKVTVDDETAGWLGEASEADRQEVAREVQRRLRAKRLKADHVEVHDAWENIYAVAE